MIDDSLATTQSTGENASILAVIEYQPSLRASEPEEKRVCVDNPMVTFSFT